MKYVGLFALTLVFFMLLSACQNIQDHGNSPDGQLSDNSATDVDAINDAPTEGEKKGSDCPIPHELEQSQRNLRGQINTIVDQFKEKIIVPESGNVRSLSFYPESMNEDARPEDEEQVDFVEPYIASCLASDIAIEDIGSVLLDRKFRESITTENHEITARAVFSRFEQLDVVVFRKIQYDPSTNRIQVSYSVVNHSDDVPSFVLTPLLLVPRYQVIPYGDPYHSEVTAGRYELFERPFGGQSVSVSVGYEFDILGYVADSSDQPVGNWKKVVITELPPSKGFAESYLRAYHGLGKGKSYYAKIDLTKILTEKLSKSPARPRVAPSDHICDSLMEIADNFSGNWFSRYMELKDEIESKLYCHSSSVKRQYIEKCIRKIMSEYHWSNIGKRRLLELSRCEL